nr:hypothetical protein [Tanacetum cinerariifolium]
MRFKENVRWDLDIVTWDVRRGVWNCSGEVRVYGVVWGRRYTVRVFRREKQLEVVRQRVRRPIRDEESASWDLWHNHMGCWGEMNGTVQVDAGVRDGLVGEMVFW